MGVIYEIFRKGYPQEPKVLKNGSLSQDSRQNTTYELYLSKIKELGLNEADYFDMLQLLKTKDNTFYRREIVLRNATDKQQTSDNLYTLASVMSTRPPIYPCPSRDCGWKCAYRNLCIEDTDTVRQTSFKVRDQYHSEYEQKEIAE